MGRLQHSGSTSEPDRLIPSAWRQHGSWGSRGPRITNTRLAVSSSLSLGGKGAQLRQQLLTPHRLRAHPLTRYAASRSPSCGATAPIHAVMHMLRIRSGLLTGCCQSRLVSPSRRGATEALGGTVPAPSLRRYPRAAHLLDAPLLALPEAAKLGLIDAVLAVAAVVADALWAL